MSSPYALHVFSRPTAVPPSLWQQWYEREHLPDMVHSGASQRAAFYRSTGAAVDPDKKYLAAYQTGIKECLDTDNYRNDVRTTSELFDDPKKGCREYGAFDPRYYELIQTYDPHGRGEGAAPFCLNVEITPYDADELDRWYKEEHLGLISKVPGWRRSIRYKLHKPLPNAAEKIADFATIHEYDNLDSTQGPEAQQMRGTEWAKKMTGPEGQKMFKVTSWELVSSVGY